MMFSPLYIAPSSPPLLITADEISSDFFYLSWDPPPQPEQNGEIIGYNVSVTNFNTGALTTIFTLINSTEVASLRPFTTYTYAVAALTTAGIGPFSVLSILTTNEAGTLYWSSDRIVDNSIYSLQLLMVHLRI